jgi:hypothetical protein
LLSSALAGGLAHIAAGNGNAPATPGAWGWQECRVGSGEFERTDWRAQGVRAGWLEADNLYLDLKAALTAVQKVGQATGSPIGVTPTTLAKRLNERGFLVSTETKQRELHVRRTLQGGRRKVLHLAASAITLEESGHSRQSGLSVTSDSNAGRMAADSGRIAWPDSDDGWQESGQKTWPDGIEPGGTGRIGGIVRIPDDGGQIRAGRRVGKCTRGRLPRNRDRRMERVAALLADARAAGLNVQAEADRLVVRGPRMHEDLALQLIAAKPRVLTVLAEEEAEIAWRVAVMRLQVPSTGPIPVLVARGGRPSPGHCVSCGDPLLTDRSRRCRLCSQAACSVLLEVREGLTP